MGSQNKPVSKQTTRTEHSTQFTISKHPKFFNAKLIHSEAENSYLEVSQSIGNIVAYEKWQVRLGQINKMIGPHSLYLPMECQYMQQGFCGTAGILKFKFQHYPFLLEQQIQNRQLQALQFQDKEIWFLLYILSQTAASLHNLGMTVGDIRPRNIFINQMGDIALLSMLAFPQQFTNYQKTSYLNEPTLLPPEGVNDLQSGKQSPSYDQTVGQSFSIGLTILDSIFLTNHSLLYDKFMKFDQTAFKSTMLALEKSSINSNLKQILRLMLSINPQTRLKCTQLCQYLAPYERQIFQLEQFEITNLLKKITQTQYLQSPTKSTEKRTNKSKRQILSRPISIQNSENKDSEGSKKAQDKQGKLKEQKKAEIRTFSIQNQAGSPRFKKQIQNSQIGTNQKEYQIQTKQFPKPSVKILQSSKGQRTCFPQDQNRTINENPSKQKQIITNETSSFNRNLYHISKPQQKVQHYGNKERLISLQTPSPHFKVEIQKKQTNMQFMTGNVFHKQRGPANISPVLNRQTQDAVGFGKSQVAPKSEYQNYSHQQSVHRAIDLRPSLVVGPAKNGGPANTQSDFLKNIDKQLEQSRRLFPSSFK